MALKVFRGLSIPVDLAPIQKYVTLGASDSGKTYMLARFAEQLADAGAFFVILDPVGKHWSLRAGTDGKANGGKSDVWVLGGQHGDVPLDPASGELIADTVIEHPGRYVLDVSGFDTDADVHRFAAAFARRLFRRKAKDPGWPMLLMLEEAESFLPQNVMKGQEHMKGAFGRIVRQGRNHGIGVFLVFQRSAAGDKGAISQCKVLIAKRMSHKRDRDAIDEWVKANGTEAERAEMMGALASLEVDEAYVWDPSWLQVFRRVRVLPRETFDSSANVKHGQRMTSVELAPLDVEALGKQIAATAERAKADDPKELRQRIRQLEAERQRLADDPPVVTETETVVVKQEIPVFDESVVAGVVETMRDVRADLAAAAEKIDQVEEFVRETLDEIRLRFSAPPAAAPTPAPRQKPARATAAPSTAAPMGMGTGDGPALQAAARENDVSSPQQRILDALAALETIGVAAPSKLQLALFAKVSPKSSGYQNNLGSLRTLGLIDYPMPGCAALTAPGREVADGHGAPATTEEMHAYVRALVGTAKAGLLDQLIAVFPQPLSKDELAERAGVSARSSGYQNNLGSLRSLGLIDYPRPGYVAALPVLFLED